MNQVNLQDVLPLLMNIMSKLDFEKLSKTGKIDKLKLIYKKTDGKLLLNITYSPPDKHFADNFLEILKMVLGSSKDVKVEFKEIVTS